MIEATEPNIIGMHKGCIEQAMDTLGRVWFIFFSDLFKRDNKRNSLGAVA